MAKRKRLEKKIKHKNTRARHRHHPLPLIKSVIKVNINTRQGKRATEEKTGNKLLSLR